MLVTKKAYGSFYAPFVKDESHFLFKKRELITVFIVQTVKFLNVFKFSWFLEIKLYI